MKALTVRALAPPMTLAIVLTTGGCRSTPANPFAPQTPVQPAAASQAAQASQQAADGASHGSLPAVAADTPAGREPGRGLAALGSGMIAAATGLGKEMESTAKQAASQVRQAAATTFDQQRSAVEQTAHQTVQNARQMAADAVDQLHQQAAEHVAQMPLEQAGPILLLAIAEGSPTARRAASEQLAARWPAAAGFPIDAMAADRALALAELRALWQAEYGRINDAVVAHTAEARRLIELSREHASEARQLVAALEQADVSEIARQQAAAKLAEYGPPLVGVLEARLAESGSLPAEIYRDVLPAVKPAFAELLRLQSPDIEQRRAAASALARIAAADHLPPLAVSRLAELLATDQDPVVWQNALVAVTSSAHASAEQMARQALVHASAEVRREAYNYLAAHPAAEHLPAIERALADPDITVQRAAVRALGSLGTLENTRPLAALLEARDKLLRVEAALALARLRVERGADVLERLALDTDQEIRLRSAEAMGEIADPVFLPALVAMLGDSGPVQHAAMQSLEHIAGQNVTQDPTLSNEQRAALWRQWYSERPAHASAASLEHLLPTSQ